MFALFVALLATIILTPELAATQEQQQQYTVWSSVIYSRTGERTPEVLGNLPTTLTSLGAQQAYGSGAFFRDRYISVAAAQDANGMEGAFLQGLSANTIDPQQLYVAALDEQYTIGSAQAFVQGLYPPFVVNSSAVLQTDPTSKLSNGSTIQNPLSGYQYAQIHTAGALDPDFPYLGGSLDCPAFDAAAVAYGNTPQFNATENASKSYYQALGSSILGSVLQEEAWDYYNAYAIWDYLNYQNAHNTTVAALLSQPQFMDAETNVSYLNMIRWYADQQQYAQLGNMTAENNYNSNNQAFPPDTAGSISTIAGNLLAARMLAQLQVAVDTGGEYYKLSVLFGDFEPLMSFFALTGLPGLNPYFEGIADFASVAVFELFSMTNVSMDMSFPTNSDDLWVRFYFRNGTGSSDPDNGNFQSYPLFNRGPSETDMSWNDFQNAMYGILLGDTGDWCTQCGASNLFCAAWNSSDAATNSTTSPITSHHSSKSKNPVIAGVIGAIVALAIASLLFAAIMFFAGLRFHRVPRNHHRKGDMGGFQGGRKMASDRDLSIPNKGGAVVGASIERPDGPESPISPVGHERVGSWELKQAEKPRPNILAPEMQADVRLSFEERQHDHDDVNDMFHAKGMRPDERV